MAPSQAISTNVRVTSEAPAAPLLYRVLRPLVRSALERHFDLAIEGLEHLPARGPYILTANHHNYLDGVVLACAVPRPVSFLVMPRVFHATPFHPPFHRHIGSILLEVGRPDVGALREALAALDAGRVVCIFPEGPFSVRGRLEPGQPGVGLLALRSGVPVVPAGIRGTYQALVGRRLHVPRHHPLCVRFGPPRRFPDLNGGSPRAARRRVTERIMADIAALLA